MAGRGTEKIIGLGIDGDVLQCYIVRPVNTGFFYAVF